MTPSMNKQLKRPKLSKNVRKTAPRMNNMIHSIETANVEQVFRICKAITRISDQYFSKFIQIAYLFWENFHRDNVRNWTQSHTTEVNNTRKTNYGHPFETGMFQPKPAINSEQKIAGHCQK